MYCNIIILSSIVDTDYHHHIPSPVSKSIIVIIIIIRPSRLIISIIIGSLFPVFPIYQVIMLMPKRHCFFSCINILFSQKFPNIFSDLTPVNKAFIACAHLVISVINWRTSRTDSSVFYHRIWNHKVVLLQNPRLLFIIFSLSNLAPHNMICIA